jgi:hypothetical protein
MYFAYMWLRTKSPLLIALFDSCLSHVMTSYTILDTPKVHTI